MIDFTHKIILITGAAGGTGQELAVELARRGASIAAVDINPIGLEETVRRIRAEGGAVKDYVVDTAKRLPIVALVDEVLDDWGRIDILVCAAVVRPTDPILSMDEWEFHRTLDVNLAGPFFLMQRVGQFMKAHGGGTIVVAHRGRSADLPPSQPAHPPQANEDAGGAAYFASQAALDALILIARQEFEVHHIQVFALEDFRL